MKTFTLFAALVGALLLAGCSTYRGGTADDIYYDDYDTGTMRSTYGVDNGWTPRPDRQVGPVIPPP